MIEITTPGTRTINAWIVETGPDQVTAHPDNATVESLTADQIALIDVEDQDVLPMQGDVRTFGGVEYVSNINYNVWTPEQYPRGWRSLEAVPEGQWTTQIVVKVGEVYSYDGGDYMVLIGHETQAGWEPPNVPALFRPVTITSGIPAWVEPATPQDAYNNLDRVTHLNAQDGGNVWIFESKINANTTEPGTDGTFHRWWTPIELA